MTGDQLNHDGVNASLATHPVHPDCKCQKCGSIFVDQYDIFPGPTQCPSCVQDEREAQKKAARQRRRR